MHGLGKENQVAYFLSRLDNNGENILVDDIFLDENIFVISTNSPWFVDISNYITIRNIPSHFSPKENKRIVKMSAPYFLIKGDIFYTIPNMIIHICVREDEMFDILKECNHKPCEGHFADKITSYNILHSGYFWPTLF